MIVLPPELAALVGGASWEQVTVGESGAIVYRLRGGGETRYLKVEARRPRPELPGEAERLRWLRGRLPVPALLYAGADEGRSYQLTEALPGVDATDDRLRAEPDRLVRLLAQSLRLVHSQPINDCPFDHRMEAELACAAANVAAGTVDAAHFHRTYAGRTAADLLDELRAARPADEDLVLVHGDYCLPNVVFDGWALSGFIDLGRCGVADRYHDLAQAARSVARNLGERWVTPFFAAYGIDQPDAPKLRFYQLLDEFF